MAVIKVLRTACSLALDSVWMQALHHRQAGRPQEAAIVQKQLNAMIEKELESDRRE